MRLKRQKSKEKNYIIKIPPNHHHNKNASMDHISSNHDNNQSIYLHKILLKNLGEQKPQTNFPNFKENIQNFQTSIQNIFSNEENRQRAMKYVINMRSKRGNLSPFELKDERGDEKNNNININNINIFSRTINDGFYASPNNKKNQANKSRDNKISQKTKFKAYKGFNIYSNNLEQFIPENTLIDNKKSKLYEEYQGNNSSSSFRNNINKNNIFLTNIGNPLNRKDISSYANERTARNNNKTIFYRKKKLGKNENLYLEPTSKNKYIDDDIYHNYSDINNYNYEYNINLNEPSESDEIRIEQNFDNSENNNNNMLKEIIIENINDLYQNQKLNENYGSDSKYKENNFDNLKIEKKRLILFGNSKYMKKKFSKNNKIIFNEDFSIKGINQKEKKDKFNVNNNNNNEIKKLN